MFRTQNSRRKLIKSAYAAFYFIGLGIAPYLSFCLGWIKQKVDFLGVINGLFWIGTLILVGYGIYYCCTTLRHKLYRWAEAGVSDHQIKAQRLAQDKETKQLRQEVATLRAELEELKDPKPQPMNAYHQPKFT